MLTGLNPEKIFCFSKDKFGEGGGGRNREKEREKETEREEREEQYLWVLSLFSALQRRRTRQSLVVAVGCSQQASRRAWLWARLSSQGVRTKPSIPPSWGPLSSWKKTIREVLLSWVLLSWPTREAHTWQAWPRVPQHARRVPIFLGTRCSSLRSAREVRWILPDACFGLRQATYAVPQSLHPWQTESSFVGPGPKGPVSHQIACYSIPRKDNIEYFGC